MNIPKFGPHEAQHRASFDAVVELRPLAEAEKTPHMPAAVATPRAEVSRQISAISGEPFKANTEGYLGKGWF